MPPEFSIEIQAQIPAALCAIHNFIRVHRLTSNNESSDLDEMDDDGGYTSDDRNVDTGPANHTMANSNDTAKQLRDQIADAMWVDYQRILRERNEEGLDNGNEDVDEDKDEDEDEDEDGDGDRDRDKDAWIDES